MFRAIILFILLFSTTAVFSQGHEPFKDNTSLAYEACINSYQNMDTNHEFAQLQEWGETDIGKPLHLFIINSDKEFNPEKFDKHKTVLYINNGIHPGEPCGIDASVLFARKILNEEKYTRLLEHTIICIIPMYNIGGVLNRGCCSRANQNGPEEYGFRGNAKNLDLNRDFIKADSKNAINFSRIYHAIKPNVFIDTHTSNGADYQYTMTLLTTQLNKIHPILKDFVTEKMEPAIYSDMSDKNWDMIPYVYLYGRTPDEGIKDYPESPRFSTGYTTLFNTIGFTSETHMLKPFSDRVESTLQLEITILEFMHKNYKTLIDIKTSADQQISQQKEFHLSWKLDTSSYRMIDFKGYEAEFHDSKLSGKQRLSYNQSRPYTRKIKYFNTYTPTSTVTAPEYYIIPQAWTMIIDRLKLNNVMMTRLKGDTTLTIEAYHITDFETVKSPYEGHYLHYNPKSEKVEEKITFYKGDYQIKVNQITNRYIVETLEPLATDSYFSWNFFDSSLQQKEWFSDYVFEEKALEILEDNSSLKKEFEKKKLNSKDFSDNHWSQLYWIYKHSGFYEATVNRIPVFRYNQ